MKTKWMTVVMFTLWAAVISVYAAGIYEKYGISSGLMAAVTALSSFLLIAVAVFEDRRIRKLNELEDYGEFNTQSEKMIKK
ncbi:MAG: hypothetical protein JW982_02345 [Spirochaetes bacterium]|nr:hypothetical protein [Spirochaetota bacterium]